MIDDISGEQGVFVLLGHCEVRGEAVQIDRGFYCGTGVIALMNAVLAEHGGDDTGEDISAAAFTQTRIGRCVDGEAAVGVGDDGAPAFEHQRHLVGDRVCARDVFTVLFDFLDTFSDQARHFAGVRRKDDDAARAVEIEFSFGNGVQGVGVEDHREMGLLDESKDKILRVGVLSQAGADGNDGFLLQQVFEIVGIEIARGNGSVATGEAAVRS